MVIRVIITELEDQLKAWMGVHTAPIEHVGRNLERTRAP